MDNELAQKPRGRPKKATTNHQPALPKKPTNGHLEIKDEKRTLTIKWGTKSLFIVCTTAVLITCLHVFTKALIK
jgi:hypothetical protein